MQLLAATGSVNTLSCGVESPELDFGALAQRITSDAAQGRIRSLLSQGKSYAAACAAVLGEAQQEAGVTAMQASSNEGKAFAGLTKPNDILALEYAKALQATDIKPLFIERRGDGYNDREISGTMSSATAIRQALNNSNDGWQQAVPASVRQALLDNAPGYDAALLWQLLRYKLRLMSVDAIADACQCSEGLENLLKDAAACPSFAEALQLCTSKRYTTSRIRRLFMQLLLDVPRWRWEDNAPAYLRVLAFNDTGRQLLKQMKATASLPIITGLYRNWPQRLQHLQLRQQQIYSQQLLLELRATELWSLLQLNPSLNRSGNDFLTSPAYVKQP